MSQLAARQASAEEEFVLADADGAGAVPPHLLRPALVRLAGSTLPPAEIDACLDERMAASSAPLTYDAFVDVYNALVDLAQRRGADA